MGSVDLENGLPLVENTDNFNTRTGNSARIPLVEEVKIILRRKENERTDSDPDEHVFTGANSGSLNPGYLSHRFRHYRELADLPDGISFHTFRHTCASMLVTGGGTPHGEEDAPAFDG